MNVTFYYLIKVASYTFDYECYTHISTYICPTVNLDGPSSVTTATNWISTDNKTFTEISSKFAEVKDPIVHRDGW